MIPFHRLRHNIFKLFYPFFCQAHDIGVRQHVIKIRRVFLHQHIQLRQLRLFDEITQSFNLSHYPHIGFVSSLHVDGAGHSHKEQHHEKKAQSLAAAGPAYLNQGKGCGNKGQKTDEKSAQSVLCFGFYVGLAFVSDAFHQGKNQY